MNTLRDFRMTNTLSTAWLFVLLSALFVVTVMHSTVQADDDSDELPTIAEKTSGMQKFDGFIPFYWENRTGKIWLQIDRLQEEFLYVNALSAGLGSNPLRLDRGQLGGRRIVSFVRSGPKIFMLQRNMRFQANTSNAAERRAVQDSFAQSILWGGVIAAESNSAVLVDAEGFFLRDAHDVIGTLKSQGERDFHLDLSRSAMDMPRTKGFPQNSEFEVTLTFKSSDPGARVREVTPTPSAVTLRQHHSFIKLPDDGFHPRRFDSRAPSMKVSYDDYSAPLDQPLEQSYIARHRLQKANPDALVSAPRKPIVYYVDPGAPEPVRTALVEGARWWNAGFEAAGFQDAFQVEILPENVDPLDVRFNVIQWVHRSTRGWSYGSSIVDPRTGEILKGLVTLGSLRVRQDRIIIEGLQPFLATQASQFGICGLQAFPEELAFAQLDSQYTPVDVALARIRQLSAHEVGHTLGFAHNFAASTNDRASVMDYPAPLVKVAADNTLDLTEAYTEEIGKWDHFAVRYAYTEFANGVDERTRLEELIQEYLDDGLRFLSDADARPSGAAHPLANLWDNGTDPVEALNHTMRVRRIALEQFGEHNIPEGEPLANLESTLVPLYLHHRYQIEAAAKMLGGVDYNYAMRGDGQDVLRPISGTDQRRALHALLETINPRQLTIPQKLLSLLPPRPFGASQSLENFPGHTAMVFDPLSAARIAADMTIGHILQRERAARLEAMSSAGDSISLADVIDALLARSWGGDTPSDPREASVARVVERSVLDQLLELAGDPEASSDVRGIVTLRLRHLEESIRNTAKPDNAAEVGHHFIAAEDIKRFLNRPHQTARPSQPQSAPPGSPIGDSGQ